MTKFWIPIQGTAGVAYDSRDEREWWMPTSLLSIFLEAHGFKQYGLVHPAGQFYWSADLDFTHHENDWHAGAKALVYYLQDVPLQHRNLLCHSHGGQVAILAAREIRVNNLILVSTPVRAELEQSARWIRSERVSGRAVHVYDKRFDFIQLLGGLFDGRIGYPRFYPGFESYPIPRAGHSNLLKDHDQFKKLITYGVMAALGSPLPETGQYAREAKSIRLHERV